MLLCWLLNVISVFMVSILQPWTEVERNYLSWWTLIAVKPDETSRIAESRKQTVAISLMT